MFTLYSCPIPFTTGALLTTTLCFWFITCQRFCGNSFCVVNATSCSHYTHAQTPSCTCCYCITFCSPPMFPFYLWCTFVSCFICCVYSGGHVCTLVVHLVYCSSLCCVTLHCCFTLLFKSGRLNMNMPFHHIWHFTCRQLWPPSWNPQGEQEGGVYNNILEGQYQPIINRTTGVHEAHPHRGLTTW